MADDATRNLNRLPAAERYHRDPAFQVLVDSLRTEIVRGSYTPTELREAVVLACTLHEMDKTHHPFELHDE